MKMTQWPQMISSVVVSMGFILSPLMAAEPLSQLSDLKQIESKLQSVAKSVMPATVALISEDTAASGTGVIVSKDGLILTAAHVVQGAKKMVVVFPDGKQVTGKVLGANYSKDSAMVQIEEKGTWPFVEMGKSKSLVAGDWVVALGHSAGFDANRPPPVRFGRVISRGPGTFLTSDCTLIGGDSGGPLFALNGQLIGINSSIGESLKNNNHAGIDGFYEDWNRLLAGDAWGQLSLNPFANPEMPVLGIGMGFDRGVKGVLVDTVVEGSPADAAGMRRGDVIRLLDGEEVKDGAELLQMLAKRQAGDEVKLAVLRNRESVDVTVSLKPRHELFEGGSRIGELMLERGDDVPLLRPEERAVVDEQSQAFTEAVTPALIEAAQSTVRIWFGRQRLAYGTVIGDGNQVLTKLSEIVPASSNLLVESALGEALPAKIVRIYEAEDLAVLETKGPALTPVKWSEGRLQLGSVLTACQPNGQPIAFGVVSVLERNLRESDQAILGVLGAIGFNGPGVKIESVAEDSGAAKAGLQVGDVILKVGKREISGLMELKNALLALKPGEVAPLLVVRDGAPQEIDVLLGNRPDFPSRVDGRQNLMERMGTRVSRVRDSFSKAIQTDMRLQPNQVGGPIVDLAGNVVGIAIARADRTCSFVMPASAVKSLLQSEGSAPDLALLQKPAQQPKINLRRMRGPQQVPQRGNAAPERLRAHLQQMQQLMEYMEEEMRALENR